MVITEKFPVYELRLPFYLEAFTDIYREATEMLTNPAQPLTATEFLRVERRRQTALYEIATLLEIPDLPPLGEQLSREQWRQCLDFMANQEQKPCPTCKGTGRKQTYYGGDGWTFERCHCSEGM
jgi:hypothetical protein